MKGCTAGNRFTHVVHSEQDDDQGDSSPQDPSLLQSVAAPDVLESVSRTNLAISRSKDIQGRSVYAKQMAKELLEKSRQLRARTASVPRYRVSPSSQQRYRTSQKFIYRHDDPVLKPGEGAVDTDALLRAQDKQLSVHVGRHVEKEVTS